MQQAHVMRRLDARASGDALTPRRRVTFFIRPDLVVDASKNWRERIWSLVIHTRARLDSTRESARSCDVSMIVLDSRALGGVVELSRVLDLDVP